MSLENHLLEELPGLTPPPGVTPDFVHPSSLQQYNVICLTACMTISTLFVAMRMYTNARITRTLNWEDYTCFVAWLGLVAFAAMNFPLRANGDGVHQWNVPLAHLIRWAQLVNIEEILLCIVTLFTRASIILLYERIFAPHRLSRIFWITQFMFYINIATTMCFMFTFIFECIPRDKLWDPTVPGHCLDTYAIFISSAVLNICIDSVLFILPQYSIWNLQMSARRKAKVSMAFVMALFAPIASIFRLIASIKNGISPDETYSTFTIGLWTAAEITTGIVVSCFPAFSAFFQNTVPKFTSKLLSFRSTLASSGAAPSSAKSSPTPKPEDVEHLRQGSYVELGSVTYPDGLPKARAMSADEVLADEGIWKTMRVDMVESYPAAVPTVYGGEGMGLGVASGV